MRTPHIIGRVLDDTPTQLARLGSLLERSDPGELPLGELDTVLTDGYALALALEAEQRRLDDHIREQAGSVGAGSALGELTKRRDCVTRDLEMLRGLLGRVRARRTAMRVALVRPAAPRTA